MQPMRTPRALPPKLAGPVDRNLLERIQAAIPDLLLYSSEICRINLVPCGQVLLHALRNARLLAAGHRGPGLWDALGETSFVDFL